MPTISTPKKLKQSRVQCTVTFTQDEVKKAEDRVVERAGQSMNLPGFRPGKAPVEMVRAKLDPEQMNEEVVRMLLPQVLDSIFKDHKVTPIIPPKVDLESKEPMKVTITFVERPEVKVKGADKINVSKTEIKADEKDFNRMLDYLKQQYRTMSAVDRAAKMDDQITMDFFGVMDGKEVEGTRANDYKIILGSKTLIPGFEEELVGLKKGDTKTFTVTFPADYHAEALKGKPVAFTVSIKLVEEVKSPEFTDAFVKEHHLGESFADLKKRIQDSLREQEERMDRGRREKELFEAIRSATTIDLAPELIAQEERTILDEIAENLAREQMTLEDWLKKSDRTWEKMRDEVKDEATKRLTLRFGIQQMMADRNVTVTDEEMKAAIDEQLSQLEPEERLKRAAMFAKGSDSYDQLHWRKRVEKMVEDLLK